MKHKWCTFSALFLTIAAGGQAVSAILLYSPGGSLAVRQAGWWVLTLSAVFGWLPIFTFRQKGKVKGHGYIHTTVLVDTGIYGIVRHPQYLAGILLNFALPMITQHWLVALLGAAALPVYCLDSIEEEKRDLEKFEEAYRRYMSEVPRFNFIAGIVRRILKERKL